MTNFDYARFGSAATVLQANVVKLNTALANGLTPPPRLTVSEWAARYRRFADDDAYGGPWKNETAPELVEIMDALSPYDPCEEVALIKCAQSGGSAAMENWIGYVSDLHPGPMLLVQGTLKAAWDWAAEKFWPMVDSTPRLNPSRNGTIRAQGMADGDGSTKQKIRFARSNGYVLMAGSNSAASLRSRTVRYAIEDDLDQFEDDVDKQGSPEAMIDARLRVWRSRGLSKRYKISTPRIKGASKIAHAYENSDARRFYMVCPHCAARFVIAWEHIQWPDGHPERAHCVAPCCGAEIEHWQKKDMKRPDGWLSSVIDGTEVPTILSETDFQTYRARLPLSMKRGFHLTGMMSTFQTWGDMAAGFIAAQGDQNKLKGWTNLVLGNVFEIKGDAPDYLALLDLREQEWGKNVMPLGVVVTTMGVDVQGDGLYFEIVGWGPDSENWSLNAGFIPGATDIAMEGAWRDLDALAKRGVVYPGGLQLPIDQECVDGGYHTEAARAYCGRRPNRLVVFGRAGWTLPVLGRGEAINYQANGRNAGRAGKGIDDKAYIVGTFGIKTTWYGWLRETLRVARADGDEAQQQIRGRCHFSRDAEESWFDQVTSEAVVEKQVNGYPRRVWSVIAGRQNHWLDCRVYNFAAAAKLQLDALSDQEWFKLKTRRYAAPPRAQGELLDAPLLNLVAEILPPEAAPKRPASSYTDRPFFDGDQNYL